MNRYYSILRPVGIGTFPKPAGNEVKTIRNFDRREFRPEISREAWGYIEYEQELSERDAADYDLVKENTSIKELKYPAGSDKVYCKYNAYDHAKRKEISVRSEEGKKRQYAYINEYKKKRFKVITLEVEKEFYEATLAPAVKKSGLSTSAYVKEAIAEKIGHD